MIAYVILVQASYDDDFAIVEIHLLEEKAKAQTEYFNSIAALYDKYWYDEYEVIQ